MPGKLWLAGKRRSDTLNLSHGDPAGRDARGQLVGRTRTDRIVVFQGSEEMIGCFVEVRVAGVTALTLHGVAIEGSRRGEPHRPRSHVALPIVG